MVPRIINRLVEEQEASIRSRLAKLLMGMKVEERVHPMVLIWGLHRLSSSARKKLMEDAATLGADSDRMQKLLPLFDQAYHLDLKFWLAKFLEQHRVPVMPTILKSLKVTRPESVALFTRVVDELGSKAVPDLLKHMGQSKSSWVREEIKKQLEKMKIKYRLDPSSGRYIVL